jgi:hypothetical protein
VRTGFLKYAQTPAMNPRRRSRASRFPLTNLLDDAKRFGWKELSGANGREKSCDRADYQGCE